MRKSVLLSAETPEKLVKKCRQLLTALNSPSGETVFEKLMVNEVPGHQSSPRAGFVWDNRPEAVASLDRFLSAPESGKASDPWEDRFGGIYCPEGVDPARHRLVAVFSGQGALYPRMGRSLMTRFPVLRQGYDYMDAVMSDSGLHPVSDLLFPDKDPDAARKRRYAKRLYETQYTQAAIGVFAAGLYRILESLGFSPDFVGGLSFGEIPSLWAGHVFSDKTLFDIVKARGIAMALPPAGPLGEGAMMAVTGKRINDILPLVDPLPDVVVESWNSREQLVLSGLKKDLENLQYTLQENGFDAFILPVSGAFHSPFMETARQAFQSDMASVPLSVPSLPVYSNLTASPYPPDPETIRRMLVDHVVKPVRFREMIENIHQRNGFAFVEFGPKKLLSRLIRNILADAPHITVPLNSGNRKRTQHLLRSPLDLLALCDGHPPIPCTTRNISKDGLRLEGLPRSLDMKKGPVQIRLIGLSGKETINAGLVWRQAGVGGLKISDKTWTDTLFKRLARHQPVDYEAGPDKDSDRQLREAVIKLRVYGYALDPLESLSGADLPSFSLPVREPAYSGASSERELDSVSENAPSAD